jgi:hypothetical protein
MTHSSTDARPAFRESFPTIHHAVATALATGPVSWSGRDEPDILATIQELASWLGPFLPRPENVAIASLRLQGLESDDVVSLTYGSPDDLLADLHVLIPYLAMVAAAIECLTDEPDVV